jgi:hypothetical protein
MPRPIVPAKNFQDPRWQQKRLEMMKRDNWLCQAQGEHKGMLNVHHRNYTTSEPWNELDENLITLCEGHHQSEHYNLGFSANAVANALKKSNWTVEHRRKLEQCILERIISPEEFCELMNKKLKENKAIQSNRRRNSSGFRAP